MAPRGGNRRPFGQKAVVIPYQQPDTSRQEYELGQGENTIGSQGFLLCQVIKKRVYIVRSLENNRFYLVKRVEKVDRPRDRATYEYNHDLPPELRISSSVGGQYRIDPNLSTSRLSWGQRFIVNNASYWELYFEYFNGGDLNNLIDKYYAAGRRIPESFIWQATSSLAKTIRWLHRGIVDGVEPPDWVPVAHQDISTENIMINYSMGRGSRVSAINNALPTVALCDFSQAAARVDGDNMLRKGRLRRVNGFSIWEDIYLLGCVLRSLCMTHVLFPADEPSGGAGRDQISRQAKNEQNRWRDRPDSRRLAAVNAVPVGQAYSEDLINALTRFEWNHQEDASVEDAGNRETCIPDVNWVYTDLCDLADRKYEEYQNQPTPYYEPMDVSWTRPWGPMPYVFNEKKSARSERRLRKSIRKDYRLVGLDTQMPQLVQDLAQPQP